MQIPPDYNDPFKPNLKSKEQLYCLHCGRTFPESDVRWDPRAELWVCPNWPKCNGAGVGFDLLPAKELHR